MDTTKWKAAQKQPKSRNGFAAASSSRISDERFAKFESDPRFRLPSKRMTRTKLDKRFAHMLDDEDFTATTQVDRYGRKLKSDKKKRALERLYRVSDDEDEEEEVEEGKGDDDDNKTGKRGGRKQKKAGNKESDFDQEVQKELELVEKKYDPARGGGFSASETDDSDSDDDDDDDDDDSDDTSDDESVSGDEGGEDAARKKAADTQRFREEEAEVPAGEVTHRLAVVNMDWDHVKARDLMAMFSSFVPKDSGGRIQRISIYPSEFGKERMRREELEGPPREIFKGKKGGRGGDDGESDDDGDDDDEDDFESDGSSDSGSDDSESDEKVKQGLLREEDDRDFDSNALRSYQLDRLRYYYAVMVCTDKATAEAIYRATDGTEYQASSNFIDLRFVPDDCTFGGDGDEDGPYDECTEVPANYKPTEFVTEALQHSKVKLTWDLHPENDSRKDLMKKAFSGTPSELIENDLRAYLASDSDGEDDGGSSSAEEDNDVVHHGGNKETDAAGANGNEDGATVGIAKLSKKERARQKMRAALGLGNEPAASGKASKKQHGPVGGMQITFTPALSENNKKAKQDGDEDAAETTLEKYKRKEKERKERRKQKAVAKREGRTIVDDEEAGARTTAVAVPPSPTAAAAVDLGFDDPFFLAADDPAAAAAAEAAELPSKTAQRKEERLKKRAAREAEAKAKAEERAQLEVVMAGDAEREKTTTQFDLREEMRAEKARKKEEKKRARKNKHKKYGGGEDGHEEAAADTTTAAAAQQKFVVDVTDPRFQAVFDDPEYAIDPSNPRFKATPGMQQVLSAVRRKRQGEAEDGEDNGGAGGAQKAKRAKTAASTAAAAAATPSASRSDELANLVNAVKRKVNKASRI
ncbi:pre-rRNA processing protein [Niveomyces insectorum RCEF 264]|uniref:Pre-rRNA processing protein n=1 Tax=Niveomyces insectorum RCEF 264 TaxID=1081102 RepID=A0A162LAH1_9HYPO|nr:pre-rRNA processing protein [Niveomyces insectorum RCEF 264]